MASVTGYSAGVETTDVVLSYAKEAAWGTAPATTFKALRFTGESLKGMKERRRPNEITGKRRVAASVTQKESASGGVNYNLSFGTYDEWFEALLGSTYSAALTIAGVAGDISTVASGNKLTSTTSGKFTAISVGQWIRLFGFTASSGVNNGFYRVTAKTSDQDITLAGKVVTNETPSGTAAKIRGSMLREGDEVQSLYVQERFASNVWMRYPALMLSGGTLQGAVGGEFTGSFQSSAKQQLDATADASTGGVTAAPTGGFFDTVGSFGGVLLDDVAIGAAVNSVNLQISREGAGMDYAMGAAAAQGGRWGQVQAGGSIEVYFATLALYQRYKSEQRGIVSWRMQDIDGNAYIASLAGSNLVNPDISASGPNAAVMAKFDIEGGNDGLLPAIQLDRFNAVA